ncbi:hypothetical protein FGO68_gene3035 [Halteria grandinella]|uniref:Uncharacterized protein n=1 Tax=Halteria grandinella TaxID=5974 RepID=A0A8J8T4N3_HALGN|nr:hypothetical protein FGO68_gene3035 [Halteria grandinella]
MTFFLVTVDIFFLDIKISPCRKLMLSIIPKIAYSIALIIQASSDKDCKSGSWLWLVADCFIIASQAAWSIYQFCKQLFINYSRTQNQVDHSNEKEKNNLESQEPQVIEIFEEESSNISHHSHTDADVQPADVQSERQSNQPRDEPQSPSQIEQSSLSDRHQQESRLTDRHQQESSYLNHTNQSLNKDIALQRLELSLDYYTLTYIGLMKQYDVLEEQEGFTIKNYYVNCLYIFGFQVVLTYLVSQEIQKTIFNFTKPDYSLLVTRFICASTLHFTVVKDVKQSMEMLTYFANHQPEFNGSLIPFMISTMKLLSSLFTELVCLWLLCGQEKVIDCIINFFALGGIGQIDDLCATTIQNCSLKSVFSDKEKMPIIRNKTKYTLNDPNAHRGAKLIIFLHWILKVLYKSVYFYFMPFFIYAFAYYYILKDQ